MMTKHSECFLVLFVCVFVYLLVCLSVLFLFCLFVCFLLCVFVFVDCFFGGARFCFFYCFLGGRGWGVFYSCALQSLRPEPKWTGNWCLILKLRRTPIGIICVKVVQCWKGYSVVSMHKLCRVNGYSSMSYVYFHVSHEIKDSYVYNENIHNTFWQDILCNMKP